ncbi:MAG TPA: nucleotide pyrophosphatase/phosphodiesterase family protein [Vicinamibacterales bacterium]|nr:nucleotide pyrophosphatase/phosphodiesterase family protein [Vicinamibacterales bacterium]
MFPRVLLVVIDGATPRIVCPLVRTGHFPVLARLAEAGTMHEASVTIFPSITPAATTSILTGAYPAEHGIAGASWYDAARGEIAYYGDDFWVIAREGFGEFVRDFLLRLNGDRLTAPTLFEIVERTGKRAACLNYLVFRGTSAHRVAMPKLLSTLPGVPLTETVEGPSLLSLGDFVGPRTAGGRKLSEKGGLFHRFGMDDASTAAMLRDLMAERSLPDFTVAYFPDNDYRSHELGPSGALPVIAAVDRMLGEAFEAGGGLERVLSDTWVIITSDHGHCEIRPDAAAAIHLDAILHDFRQAALGRPWQAGDEILICPNMRAAQIYLAAATAESVERVAAAALADPRIDLAIWRAGPDPDDGYVVVSSRGRVTFRRANGVSSTRAGRAGDAFGTIWSWEGELAVLDLIDDGGVLYDGQYPNPFERIANALDLEKSGDVWLTAEPGCEFQVPGGEAHRGGGSHGALHALDSHSPVIVAGPERMTLPRAMRSVDLAPLCTSLLGMSMRYAVGQPRGPVMSGRVRDTGAR